MESIHDCKPPFSFFFDLVGRYWRASSSPLPLHRACTLARKQGVTYCTVDAAFNRQDIVQEITQLDDCYGSGGGAAEAITISFFRSDEPPDNIDDIPDDGFLGQVVLINYRQPGSSTFTRSYIYEAIFKLPTLADGSAILNTIVSRDAEFRVTVRGREFKTRSVFYGQQNSTTNVCAHACLRMALNSFGGIEPQVTNAKINEILNASLPFKTGLSLKQLGDVIESVGVKASVYDCKKIAPPMYFSTLASIVESGDLAMLVFTTGHQDSSGQATEHVVTVFGHTRNSDEWHPQAIPAYAGPKSAPYFASSSWTDHFLIHDDNFGPYFTLSTHALEIDAAVKPLYVIALRKEVANVPPAYIEALAAVMLTNFLPSLAGQKIPSRWFEYITRTQRPYVLRPLLLKREDYLKQLKSSKAHDGTNLSDGDEQRLAKLPERFWVVEFSLPELYTGNRSKLGEVIFDAVNAPNSADLSSLLLALRVPGVLVMRDGPDMATHACALLSHCPLHYAVSTNSQW